MFRGSIADLGRPRQITDGDRNLRPDPRRTFQIQYDSGRISPRTEIFHRAVGGHPSPEVTRSRRSWPNPAKSSDVAHTRVTAKQLCHVYSEKASSFRKRASESEHPSGVTMNTVERKFPERSRDSTRLFPEVKSPVYRYREGCVAAWMVSNTSKSALEASSLTDATTIY